MFNNYENKMLQLKRRNISLNQCYLLCGELAFNLQELRYNELSVGHFEIRIIHREGVVVLFIGGSAGESLEVAQRMGTCVDERKRIITQGFRETYTGRSTKSANCRSVMAYNSVGEMGY